MLRTSVLSVTSYLSKPLIPGVVSPVGILSAVGGVPVLLARVYHVEAEVVRTASGVPEVRLIKAIQAVEGRSRDRDGRSVRTATRPASARTSAQRLRRTRRAARFGRLTVPSGRSSSGT